MNIDFNNLRKQACYAYDRLARTLNSKITKDDLGDTKDDLGDFITVETDDIQKDMDELRQLIMFIACVYKDGDDEIKSVDEEVQPIAWFNNYGYEE
jgi:hypothetical protein